MSDLTHAAEGDIDLHGDADAQHWAERFADKFVIIKPDADLSGPYLSPHLMSRQDVEGLMLAWFAGAIETGRMAASHPVNGHGLWEAIVAKHGVDRCPTVEGQALWACGELGELGQAIQKALFAGHDPQNLGLVPAVRKELADAGLALYGVAVKLGLDLNAEMMRVVDEETRDFRPAAELARHEESYGDGEIYSEHLDRGGPSAATQAYGATGCT